MKTKSLFIAFISLVLALSVISCNNDTAYEGVKNNAEYVKLHIGQMGLNSRQIDKVDFYEEYKDASYVLSGSLKTEDDKFEKEYKGLSELETASIEIKTGTWTFTLLAYNSDDEIKTNGILSDTKEFEITSDSKTLDFSLEFCEEQTLTGNLEYTVTVPYVDSASMTVTLVKDGTVFSPKEPYDVLSGYSKSLFAVDPVSYKKYGQMSTGNEVIEMLPLVQKDASYQTTFTFDNLPVGTYQLRIVYTTDYMEDALSRDTQENETNIVVYPLVTRTGSTIIKNINKAYKITYAKSEAYSPDTSNLPNVIDKLGKITLPALERTQYTFDGWYYWLNDEKKTLTSDVDKDGKTVYILYGSTLSSNVELYTAWTEIPLGEFAVKFNSMGGSPVDNQTIEENSCATKPADPERTGYTFGGWYTSSDYLGEAYDFATPVTEAIILYANWKVESYTITYSGIDEDTTNPNADITTYTIESDTISLADASKTGYTFCGWFDWGGNKVTSIDKGSTGNRAFEAQWTIEEYEVTFMTNCYNGTSDKPINYSFVVSYNEKASEYVQRISPLTREGYTLEGWYTDSTFKNKYNFDTPVTAALTLYANWTINTYTITYSSVNGEAPTDKTVNWGTKLSEDDIAEIEAEGWVFKGWKIGETNTYATTETTVTDNLTLIADWSIAQITISYETTLGTAPETQTVDYGTILATAHLEEIEAVGYDFNGWLLDGKEAEAGTTLKANITLTASWTAKTYSITYYGVDDAENPNDTAKYTIESEALTLADASKDGYTFKGWFTTETFEEGTEVTEIAAGSTGDKVFYAKWEIKTFEISYTSEHGTAPSVETVEWMSDLSRYLPNLEEEGYKFNGWKLGGQTVTGGYEVTENIELVADWSLVEYKITLEGLEDAEYTEPARTYTVETETILLGEPTKEGYDFGGWYTSSDFEEGPDVTEIPAGSTGDKTFYAKWTPITYNIIYKLDGGENPAAAVETYTIEDEVTLPTPEKSGYTFLGWYDAETDGNKVETISIGSTEDKEYWAKWSQTFTISVEFEAIPKVTAAGSWELVKESRTVHNDITDEDEQYDVFVAPEGWTTYTWYVDGVQVEVDSETPNEYRPSGSGGTHSVNCLIIRTVTGDDGEDKQETIYLTGSFTLTVQYQPMG